jgi:hypothetical protein
VEDVNNIERNKERVEVLYSKGDIKAHLLLISNVMIKLDYL